jgi:hypothetical protein
MSEQKELWAEVQDERLHGGKASFCIDGGEVKLFSNAGYQRISTGKIPQPLWVKMQAALKQAKEEQKGKDE